MFAVTFLSKQIRGMIRAAEAYEGEDVFEALKSEECKTLLHHVSAHGCLCVCLCVMLSSVTDKVAPYVCCHSC